MSTFQTGAESSGRSIQPFFMSCNQNRSPSPVLVVYHSSFLSPYAQNQSSFGYQFLCLSQNRVHLSCPSFDFAVIMVYEYLQSLHLTISMVYCPFSIFSISLYLTSVTGMAFIMLRKRSIWYWLKYPSSMILFIKSSLSISFILLSLLPNKLPLSVMSVASSTKELSLLDYLRCISPFSTRNIRKEDDTYK